MFLGLCAYTLKHITIASMILGEVWLGYEFLLILMMYKARIIMK